MITIQGLKAEFEGNIIFRDFSLEIVKGEKVLLDGPSGSGKTTIFRMLLGLAVPKAGHIDVGGLRVGEDTIHDVRKKISYLSQDIDFRSVKVKDLLQEIFSYDLNKDVAFDDKAFTHLLGGFGLQRKIMGEDVDSLSGGERQRLGLAVCFALERPILLLDEPTSALDSARKGEVADKILSSDKTVMVISHDPLWKKKTRVVKLGHS